VQLQLHAAILITAACTGFVQVVEAGRLPAARSFRPEHIQPGTLMSDSILVTYRLFGPYTACCYLLAVVLQLPAQGLCSMPTQPGTGCRRLTASHANKQAYVHYRCAKAVQGKLVSCSCLQVNLATAGCTGFVHMSIQPAAGCTVC
jgi:hypothetical protein